MEARADRVLSEFGRNATGGERLPSHNGLGANTRSREEVVTFGRVARDTDGGWLGRQLAPKSGPRLAYIIVSRPDRLTTIRHREDGYA